MKRGLFITLACLSLFSCTAAPPETLPETKTETTGAAYYQVPYPTENTFLTDEGEHNIRMLFVNAGKADCIILEADGLTYLIDTGEDTSVPKILSALAWMETEAIEAVFLTHSDKDHIGGWDAITEAYSVEALYTAVQREAPKTYERMAEGKPYYLLSAGQSVPIGNEGLYLDTLCPVYLYPVEENNNSLILRLDYGTETALFSGDMKALEEADLLEAGYDLDCTILKVPYHGRKDSSGSAFLEACTPALSIICSSTETDPDTAHKKVMERLRTYGEVRRTEDAELGWFVTMDADSHTVSAAAITHSRDVSLELEAVSRKEQTVTIRNTGEDADLGGCFLYSDRGSEVYIFPEDTRLAAGESLTLGCVGTRADLVWTGETGVWHKSKEDKAILYDRWGNILDSHYAE